MDLDTMHTVLCDHCEDVQRDDHAWTFSHQDVACSVITDKRHDRMRIIAEVCPADTLTEEHTASIMQANFHTALDARYAVSDGTLYSAFIHPLGSLSEDLFVSALQQVASLVVTFGTKYSSGALTYGRPPFPKTSSS